MQPMSSNERFEYCVNIIIDHEGGLCNDKRDPGGITKWGVSLRFLRIMGIDMDGSGHIDENDIIGLTKHRSKLIYKKYWWEKYHYNELKDLKIAAKVFDLSVNMGPMASHKILQIAINRLREKPIPVDGLLGSMTFATANAADSRLLMQELREGAKHKYIQILADHPNMEWCRNGWMNRAAW